MLTTERTQRNISHIQKTELLSLFDLDKDKLQSQIADWSAENINRLMLISSEYGHETTLRCCLETGRAFINHTDLLGNTALHHVMKLEDNAKVRRLANLLLDYNIDEHLKNHQSQSPTDFATRENADWLVQNSRQRRLRELREVQTKLQALEASVHTLSSQLTTLFSGRHIAAGDRQHDSSRCAPSETPQRSKL